MDGQGKKESLNFEWLESASDGRISRRARNGFGMELLSRILPYDLGAKTSVEFLKEGLRFTMDLPGEHVTDTWRG